MSDHDALSLEGELSPPMANGEVIFEAPWQSRVFGMARALCEAGQYDWDEFRTRLIAQLAGASEENFQYFDYFLAALSTTLEEKGICTAGELNERVDIFAARPHGHDHDHSDH